MCAVIVPGTFQSVTASSWKHTNFIFLGDESSSLPQPQYTFDWSARKLSLVFFSIIGYLLCQVSSEIHGGLERQGATVSKLM